MWVGGQHHDPTNWPPGKTRYPLYEDAGWAQNRSEEVRKISPPTGFDPRTVQPVVSLYTDWAILASALMRYVCLIKRYAIKGTGGNMGWAPRILHLGAGGR